MNVPLPDPRLASARRLVSEVLDPLKRDFVGKDEVVDLLGVCLVAGENLFLFGPPGTAKSALVQRLAARLNGRVFDYLLTRFTEPNELFGPFDIRRLREGDLVTNTEGMLPEAEFVFLDELLNANSAILNSLLTVLNERVFRRGRETRALPLMMTVGASNRLPEDDALGALFDRFLMRVRCDNVPGEQLQDVLLAGWELDRPYKHEAPASESYKHEAPASESYKHEAPASESGSLDPLAGASCLYDGRQSLGGIALDEVRTLHDLLRQVDLSTVRGPFVELVHRLRHAGIGISDRRAVKLQRLLAASAMLCGRMTTQGSDLWVLRYIWDTEEQQEVLAAIVQDAVDKSQPVEDGRVHPRSRGDDLPDPEQLAGDLERLAERLAGDVPDTDRSYLRDRLGWLASRCQWVADGQQRSFLDRRLEELWPRVGGRP